MKILVIEDRAEIMANIVKYLKELRYEIKCCYNIHEADVVMQENRKSGTPFHCYIFDLAMQNTWIDDESQKAETQLGYFTGWVWIKNNVIKGDENNAKKCIVFSAYIDSFIDTFTDAENKKYIKKMLIIDKSDLEWRKKIKEHLEQFV